MKPGYTTTEFYVTLTAWLASVIAGAAHFVPPSIAVGLGTVAGIGYAISRGLAKLNAAGVTSLDPAALLAEVEKFIASTPPPKP
jgi:hypothetical protein